MAGSMLSCTLTLMLVICLVAGWEKPIRVLNHGKSLALYLDPQSGASHTVYRSLGSNSEVGIAYYTRVGADGKIGPAIMLDPSGRETRHADIVGVIGSTKLVIVLDMYRESSRGACNAYKGETKGCLDTFVTISYNSGDTWSDLEPVPRSQNPDFAARYAPSVIHIKEINRVLISYTYDGVEGKRLGLAAWQVAAGNGMLIPHLSNKESFGPKVASESIVTARLGYTVDSEMNVGLRLVWQQSSLDGEYGLFATSTSSDLGRTWSARAYLGTFDLISASRPLFSVSYLADSMSVGFSKYQGEVHVAHFVKGTNLTVNLPNKVYSVATCLSGNRLHVMQSSFYFLRYGYIDLEKKTYVAVDDEVYPARYAAVERMACFEAGGKVSIRALADLDFWPNTMNQAVELLRDSKNLLLPQ